MVGSLLLVIVAVFIGIVLAAAVPGFGPILGVLVVVAALVLAFSGIAGKRRRGTTPSP